MTWRWVVHLLGMDPAVIPPQLFYLGRQMGNGQERCGIGDLLLEPPSNSGKIYANGGDLVGGVMCP